MAKLREITVSCALTYPHPTVKFGMFKPMVSVTADIDESEDPHLVHGLLQEKVNLMAKSHLETLYKSAIAKAKEKK